MARLAGWQVVARRAVKTGNRAPAVAACWSGPPYASPPPPIPPHPTPPAVTGDWVVFVGGLTEQRSLMGIKSRSEYLSGKLPCMMQ